MAHRGRLNVLANILGKSPRAGNQDFLLGFCAFGNTRDGCRRGRIARLGRLAARKEILDFIVNIKRATCRPKTIRQFKQCEERVVVIWNIGTFGTVLETKSSGSGIADDFALVESQIIPAFLVLPADTMLGMIPALLSSTAGVSCELRARNFLAAWQTISPVK